MAKKIGIYRTHTQTLTHLVYCLVHHTLSLTVNTYTHKHHKHMVTKLYMYNLSVCVCPPWCVFVCVYSQSVYVCVSECVCERERELDGRCMCVREFMDFTPSRKLSFHISFVL